MQLNLAARESQAVAQALVPRMVHVQPAARRGRLRKTTPGREFELQWAGCLPWLREQENDCARLPFQAAGDGSVEQAAWNEEQEPEQEEEEEEDEEEQGDKWRNGKKGLT